jgi:hypothetical protein
VAGRDGELDERQPLRVVVQAVALGVECDLARRPETLRDLGEGGVGLDPAGFGRGDGTGLAQAFVWRSACSWATT